MFFSIPVPRRYIIHNQNTQRLSRFLNRTLTKGLIRQFWRRIGLAKLARLSFSGKDKLRVPGFTLRTVFHGPTNGGNPIIGGKTMMDTPGMQASLDNLVYRHEFHAKVGRRLRPGSIARRVVVVGRHRAAVVVVGGGGMLHFLFSGISKSSVNVFSFLKHGDWLFNNNNNNNNNVVWHKKEMGNKSRWPMSRMTVFVVMSCCINFQQGKFLHRTTTTTSR